MPGGLPKALTEDEVNRLLDAVVGDDPVACRDRAVLEVLYGTGLRIAELVGLSLADVDLEDAQLRAFGKGAKERIVPLGRPAVNALRAWLDPDRRGALTPDRWARRTDAEAVFLNVARRPPDAPGRLGDRAQVRQPGGPGRPAHAARAAPLVRHPHARPRGRHPLRPGAPRPRLGEHHADLHPGVDRAALAGLPRRPPPRPLGSAAPPSRTLRGADASCPPPGARPPTYVAAGAVVEELEGWPEVDDRPRRRSGPGLGERVADRPVPEQVARPGGGCSRYWPTWRGPATRSMPAPTGCARPAADSVGAARPRCRRPGTASHHVGRGRRRRWLVAERHLDGRPHRVGSRARPVRLAPSRTGWTQCLDGRGRARRRRSEPRTRHEVVARPRQRTTGHQACSRRTGPTAPLHEARRVDRAGHCSQRP